MLILAAILFAIAAIGGVAMAYIHFSQDRNPPGALAAAHGAAAGIALILLIWVVTQREAAGLLGWALAMFVIAALGGFVLVGMHLNDKRLPSPFIVIHGLVAIIASVLLLIGMA